MTLDSAENGPPAPCRLGYVEYDGDQYCFEHGGFRHFYVPGSRTCDRARVSGGDSDA